MSNHKFEFLVCYLLLYLLVTTYHHMACHLSAVILVNHLFPACAPHHCYPKRFGESKRGISRRVTIYGGCCFFPKEITAITISYRGVIMICSHLFWPDIVERKHHKAADVALSHQWWQISYIRWTHKWAMQDVRTHPNWITIVFCDIQIPTNKPCVLCLSVEAHKHA